MYHMYICTKNKNTYAHIVFIPKLLFKIFLSNNNACKTTNKTNMTIYVHRVVNFGRDNVDIINKETVKNKDG